MRGIIRYIVAGVSLGTGLFAYGLSRQIDRDLRGAFALTAEDLP